MGFLPNLVPDNAYYMDAPKGFEKNEVDGFFIRNTS